MDLDSCLWQDLQLLISCTVCLRWQSVSYGYAITTYVGQNLGDKRISQDPKWCPQWRLHGTDHIYCDIRCDGDYRKKYPVTVCIRRSGQVKQVLDIAYKYLFIMAIFLWVLYLLYVYRSAIQGLGNTLIPLASGVVEFCMRVGVALLLPKLIGEDGIFYAEISAWSGAAILLIVSYVVIIRKYKE